jgi:hypothetical protein
MKAMLETTVWKHPVSNHTYLLDGNNLVAYIKTGSNEPFYFKNPIKGFDKRGRKFEELKLNPFKVKLEKSISIVQVAGSKGNMYEVDTAEKTCTCPGYIFRGSCKHVSEIA